jgi:DNA-binding NarL/FixJ family response regulator
MEIGCTIRNTPRMTNATPIRVLLAEDHPMVRQSLRTILEAFPNVLIVGESTTGEEAVASAGTLQPDIVLMDINIPLLDGIAATRMIKARHPHIAVVGLTCHTPEYLVYAMTKAGAFDVLPKEKALDLYEVMQRAIASTPVPKGISAIGDSASNLTSLEH